jgi:hypothetical protein
MAVLTMEKGDVLGCESMGEVKETDQTKKTVARSCSGLFPDLGGNFFSVNKNLSLRESQIQTPG